MRQESGATITEYLIMVAGIAVALVAVILLFQEALTGSYTETSECVQSAMTSDAEDCPGAERQE